LQLPLVLDKEKIRLTVVASVNFSGRVPIPVSFIVDTGSPSTFVDEFNSAKVRIFTKNLPFDSDSLMGGTKVAMYKAGEVVMKFKNEVGDLFEIKYDDMKVAKTEWTRRAAIYSGVSILGLDFFLKNKFSLHINTIKDTSYIETEESA